MTETANRKTRIIHIISGDLWAGAEVMAFNLLISLNKLSDLDIQVILLNEGRLAQELRKSGIVVNVIDEKVYPFWKIFRNALAVTADNHPDIIHSHRYKENLIAFLISRCLPRLKLISTQHGLPEIFDSSPSLFERLKYKANFYTLSRFFHKTVAVSEDICNTMISRFGFAHNRIAVIHNGINLPTSFYCSKKGNAHFFTIGSSGRLFPVKNYPLMVEIARLVKLSGNLNIRFELAGDGPDRAQLECLIERYGLQNQFIIRGHQDDMDAFYCGLDVYLNTSFHEGIPMTIIEAFGHGLPVIAPAVGGIVEIIKNGEDGYLIDNHNPDDFVSKCLQLYEDGELRKQMSLSARVRAEQTFSAKMMAKSYSHIYKQI